MAFYALCRKPLQDILKQISPLTKQVWLVEDATGSAYLTNLNHDEQSDNEQDDDEKGDDEQDHWEEL